MHFLCFQFASQENQCFCYVFMSKVKKTTAFSMFSVHPKAARLLDDQAALQSLLKIVITLQSLLQISINKKPSHRKSNLISVLISIGGVLVQGPFRDQRVGYYRVLEKILKTASKSMVFVRLESFCFFFFSYPNFGIALARLGSARPGIALARLGSKPRLYFCSSKPRLYVFLFL